SFAKENISARLVLETLEALSGSIRANNAQGEVHAFLKDGMSVFHLQRLFGILDEDASLDVTRLLRLELDFLPLLKASNLATPHLWKAFAESPDLFLDLLGRMYRRKGEEPLPEGEEREQRRALAERAHTILRAWGDYPGKGLPVEERDIALERWATYVLD